MHKAFQSTKILILKSSCRTVALQSKIWDWPESYRSIRCNTQAPTNHNFYSARLIKVYVYLHIFTSMPQEFTLRSRTHSSVKSLYGINMWTRFDFMKLTVFLKIPPLCQIHVIIVWSIRNKKYFILTRNFSHSKLVFFRVSYLDLFHHKDEITL